MDRREFLGFTAATSGMLILAGCGDGSSGKTMVLKRGTPNPASGIDELYIIEADPGVHSYTGIKGATEEAANIIGNVVSSTSTHKVRIFHTNDVHNHTVDPSSSKGDTNRLAQLAKTYRTALETKAGNETVLLFSAGDDHTGNVLDELRGFDLSTFVTDPSYTMYSALGYSAAVIGNHELDKGGELLKHSIEQCADMTILSANVTGSKHLNSTHYVPASVLVNNGLRIGVIGLTTPNETAVLTEEDPKRIVANPADVINRTLPQLAQCSDMIVILSHLGYGGEEGQIRHDADVADIDIAQLAAQLTSKPVIIIGGHSHTVLNENGLEDGNVVNGVLITQAGGNGSHYGEITATVTIQNSESTSIAYENVQLHKIKSRDDRESKHDPDVHETDDDIDLAFKSNVTDPIIALLGSKLDEVIAGIEFSSDISQETTIAERYVGECAIANFMNDAIVAQSESFPGREGEGIDLAAFNASGVNAGIEDKANLTFQDWYSVMPYADSIYLTEMTGQQIKEMVESNVTRILLPSEKSENGGDFSTSGFISWGFLHFSKALTYTVSYDESTRTVMASDIKMHGQAIENQLSAKFKVSFSSYIAGGNESWKGDEIGANHPGNGQAYDLTQLELHDTGLVYRNEIIAYIRSQGVLGASTGAAKDGRIQIV